MIQNKIARRTLFLLAIIATFFAGDRILALALEKIMLQSGHRVSRVYRGGIPPGVLFIGNSRGVNAFFAPDIGKELGIPVFNLSYNDMSIYATEALLLDFLEHNEKPRLFVMEMAVLESQNDLINDLKCYTRKSKRLRALLRDENPVVDRIGSFSHLYKFNCETFLRNIYYLTKDDQDWINNYTIDEAFIRNLKQDVGGWSSAFVHSEEKLAVLNRILNMLKERGIPIRLLISPYLLEFIEAFPHFDDWKRDLQAAVGEQFPIWDYSRKITDWKEFADSLHMNRQGNRTLFKMLNESGFYQLESEGFRSL